MALSGSRLGIVSNELLDSPDRIIIGAALREDEDDPAILSLLDIAERHFASGESGEKSR